MLNQLFNTLNLNNYKFIINSGCSYGRITNSIIAGHILIKEQTLQEFNEPRLIVDGNVIIINVALSSSSHDWQSDSVIYVCSKLLNLGINPSNLYTIVEWSQWSRLSTPLYQFINLNYLDLKWDTEFKNDFNLVSLNNESDIKKYLTEYLDIRKGINPHNIGRIESNVYITPNHLADNSFKSFGVDFEEWHLFSKKVYNSIPLDTQLKYFINNILKTQWFLKSNNIPYNFLSMQGNFSNWYKDEKSLIKHKLTHDEKVPFENHTFVNNKESDLEIQLPQLKYFFDLIDLSNFWFFENENFRRGGIDEWALSTFKEVGYTTFETSPKGSAPNIVLPQFDFHPNYSLYMLLWNKVATNCKFVKVNQEYENWFMEKFWEDYNLETDEYTKHGITVSKKWFYKNI
jgi:hypothetical protein